MENSPISSMIQILISSHLPWRKLKISPQEAKHKLVQALYIRWHLKIIFILNKWAQIAQKWATFIQSKRNFKILKLSKILWMKFKELMNLRPLSSHLLFTVMERLCFYWQLESFMSFKRIQFPMLMGTEVRVFSWITQLSCSRHLFQVLHQFMGSWPHFCSALGTHLITSWWVLFQANGTKKRCLPSV